MRRTEFKKQKPQQLKTVSNKLCSASAKTIPPRNDDGKVCLPPLPWYPHLLLNSSQKSPAVVHHHRYHQFFHLLHFQPGL